MRPGRCWFAAFASVRERLIRGRPWKTSAQNREKLTPFPLVRKMSVQAQPPLSVRTRNRCFLCQKVRTSVSEELPSPLSANCPLWTNPLPPWLRTGPLFAFFIKSVIVVCVCQRRLNTYFVSFYAFFVPFSKRCSRLKNGFEHLNSIFPGYFV